MSGDADKEIKNLFARTNLLIIGDPIADYCNDLERHFH